MTHAYKITFYKIVCEYKPPTLYSCSSIPSHPSHLPTIKSVHTHLCNSQSMLMCGVTLSNVCCTSYLLFLFVYKIIQPNPTKTPTPTPKKTDAPSQAEKVAHKALLAIHTSLGGQAPANPYEDAWSTVVATAGAAPGTIEIDLSGSAFKGKTPYGVRVT